MRPCTALLLALTGCLPDPDLHIPDFSLPFTPLDMISPPPPVDMAAPMGWLPGPSAGGNTILRSVWVSDANLGTVYVAGLNGTLLRGVNGAALVSETSGTTQSLYAVLGVSADEAYAAGAAGTVLHRMGGQWMVEAAGVTTKDLYGLTSPAAGEVYAVGNSGTVLHRLGGAWSAEAGPNVADLRGVWAKSVSEVYAVGNQSVWQRTAAWAVDSAIIGAADQGSYFAVSGVDGTPYLAGDQARVLRRDGVNLKWVAESTIRPATPPAFYGLYGLNGEILVVGTGGAIEHRTGGATPTWASETSGTTQDLFAVYGGSVHAALAVGTGGTILRRY